MYIQGSGSWYTHSQLHNTWMTVGLTRGLSQSFSKFIIPILWIQVLRPELRCKSHKNPKGRPSFQSSHYYINPPKQSKGSGSNSNVFSSRAHEYQWCVVMFRHKNGHEKRHTINPKRSRGPIQPTGLSESYIGGLNLFFGQSYNDP